MGNLSGSGSQASAAVARVDADRRDRLREGLSWLFPGPLLLVVSEDSYRAVVRHGPRMNLGPCQRQISVQVGHEGVTAFEPALR